MELAIILMMLLIIVAVGAMKLYEPSISFPFQKKVNLFTPVERSFLDLIESAVGREYRVMCRVKMSDILAVRKNADKKTIKNALSKAGSKQFDFVLCAKDSMAPVIAIDLVHNKGKDGYKNQRDYFVSGALDAARVPHLRIKVRSGYTVKDIQDSLQAKLPNTQLVHSPFSQPPSKLREQLINQGKPTRPIKTNKTVGRPVVAA
jgi:hypothetical protein